MKKILAFLLILSLFSCKDYITKPENLIPKSQMSEIVADLAINNQMPMLNREGNMETGARFILKKYNIKGDDFDKSYKYYTVTKEIKGILKDAQEIVLEKHPEAESFLENKTQKEKEMLEKPIELNDIERPKREEREIK